MCRGFLIIMIKITRSKFKCGYIIGLGFLNIFDGLIMILTLGNYTTQTTLGYVLKYHQNLKNKND